MSGVDKIRGKIKKLLALSKSPNPHEAAAALEMAQRLMAEYKVDRSEINSLVITEEAAPAERRRMPPVYEALLIRKIAAAFGCERFYHIKEGRCAWNFIGLNHRAQVAAFIAQVLLRKLKSARQDYTKTLYRVRSRYRKTQRADDFCIAWVSTVTEKLPVFSGAGAGEKKEIERFVKTNHPKLKDFSPPNRTFGNKNDYLQGRRAGEGVTLQHGVGMESGAPLAIGGRV
jgi:hypothetical protein